MKASPANCTDTHEPNKDQTMKARIHSFRGFKVATILLAAVCGGWAQKVIRTNAGGASSTFTSAAGEQWTTDRYFSGGDLNYTGDPIGNTQDRYLYATARAGLYTDFSYNIPVANGNYRLTMKFAEVYYWYTGDRVFNVTVNGAPVLTNFDILAEVPARTALDKTFDVAVTNGVVQIDFKGVIHRAIVSAIELEPSTTQPVTVAVNPTQATLAASGTQKFTATVGGTTNTAVTWSAAEGTIAADGTYTAPASIAQTHTTTVTARSVANSTVSASATVTLKTPVVVSVSPASASLASGQTATFTAGVTGTSDTRVTWSASAGTVSSTGTFTAPQVSSATTVTVTATSVADPTASGAAQVQVAAAGAPAGTTPVFQEANGQVTFEAEQGTIINRTQQWVPQTSAPGFSGAGYLTASPNTGVYYDSNYAGVAPEVQIKVNFRTAGTYYVWVRGYSTGPADDSVNVGIDGNPVSTGWRLSMFPANAWGWSSSVMDNVGRTTVSVSSAGVHTINVWMREDGFSIDKLVLSTDPNFTPTGLGPAVSPTDSTSPVLSLSTTNLAFTSSIGAVPATQTVAISNLGGGTMSWTASDSQAWLSVSPASGTDSGVLTVSVNPAGLAAGNYTGAITVTASGASGSPKTINVTLSIAASVTASLSVPP